MKAAILLPVLADRDAVGFDAVAMARLLRERGIETRLFCGSASGTREKHWPPEKLVDFAGGPDDLVIYHFSMGWPPALEILRRCRGFRVVRYHNITPPEFFQGLSNEYVAACRSGREEIPEVADSGCELYVGASQFNLDELLAHGIAPERGAVLAPLHRIPDLLDVEGDMRLIDELNDGALNVLMVGRIAPNKGYPDLVDAFAAHAHAYNRRTRLVLVGKIDPRLESYTNAIRQRIAEYGLTDRVRWINGASEAELKATYVASHAFMLTSRHEGFCVPLVEAMAIGTPIIARETSAIPETLGGCGISWPEADPSLFAASLSRLVDDADLRNGLRHAGMRRYRETYAMDVLRRRFFDLVLRTAA